MALWHYSTKFWQGCAAWEPQTHPFLREAKGPNKPHESGIYLPMRPNGSNLKIIIFKHMLWSNFMSTSCEIVLSWMPQNTLCGATKQQAITWANVDQDLSPAYDVTRPQWVKARYVAVVVIKCKSHKAINIPISTFDIAILHIRNIQLFSTVWRWDGLHQYIFSWYSNCYHW